MPRWRRLGVLIPPVNITVEREFPRWAPEGVTIHVQRMYRAQGVLSPEDLSGMLDYLDEDARRLAFAQLQFIIYACTSGSSLETGGYDKRIAAQIEQAAGVAASTTATAVTEALRHFGVRNMSVVTPYPQDINDKEMAFFQELGFETVGLESFLQRDSLKVPLISQAETYKLAKQADRAAAEALFISCTNLPTADIIEPLEQELGKPVLTSNQTSMWLSLRRMGVDEPVHGAGQLLREPMAALPA
ncbi:MAG: maleate cis-trans isomerase [bacterium]|nr:maleate cis-trans isomerase [bacterium]